MKQIEPEELTLEDGRILVKKARESVEKAFIYEEAKINDVPEKLRRPGAAFVTINIIKNRKKELRGCIGYVKPVYPLIQTVIEVAREAAFNDPRFPPLQRREYPFTHFEVSVLSGIRELPRDPEERLKSIVMGKMGLMVVRGIFSGLLLPQVPIEEGWDKETFLEYTCYKAGLEGSCWKDEKTEFYYFVARVFEEKYPFGEIIEKEL
ncbi:AmmeMemoRadiSam system protein A [Fervidicoccus sp.]|uniref:AmmeMemoRadiSam system protein A n=1 Tax=Fervidicoccus sp. TaxID=2060324 RepID=UPI003D13914C